MVLRDSLATLMRRWYLVLPAVLLSLLVGIGAFAAGPKKYESQARLLLLPSAAQAGATGGPGNPYLSLTAGLGMTADVVAVGVSNDQTIARLAQEGAVGTYTVASDLDVNAPVLIVTVDDQRQATVTRTLLLVEREIRAQLDAAQQTAGAPKSTWISISTLSQSPEPVAVLKAQLQVGIAGGAGCLILLLAGVALVDRRRVRAHRATDSRQAPAPQVPATDRERAVGQQLVGSHASIDLDEESVARIRA